jgi:hypothetical protein
VIVNDPGGGEGSTGTRPMSDFPLRTASHFGQNKGKEMEGFGPNVVDSEGMEDHNIDRQLPDHDMEWDGAPPEYTPRGGWQ